jgi:hypothetical protein
VGQHSFNRHGGGVDLNAVDFGTAYRPEYQDPSQAPSGTPGAEAVTTNLLRPYRGLGELDQETQRHWRTFHSLQMSMQRRFRSGISGGFNYTLSLSDRSNEGTDLRLQHGPDGSLSVRSDQDQYEELMENAGLIRHVLKANFVWELPGLSYSGNVG